MRRLLLLPLLLLFCGSAHAAPNLVRSSGCSSGATDGTTTYASMKCALAGASDGGTVSGNILICYVQYAVNAGITSVTIQTDQSDTFTQDRKGVATDTNQTIIIAHVAATAGSKLVTFTYNGSANSTFTQSGCAEFSGTNGTTDGCNDHTATATAMTAGSITTTTGGDLLVAVFEPETGVGGTSWTAGSSAALMQSDIGYGAGQTASQMAEWVVQGSAGAINMAATQAPSATYGAVVCAYKANAQGGNPSTSYYTTSVQHYNVKTLASGGKVPAPITGNLGVLHCITAPSSGPITAVSGSVTGSWTKLGSNVPNHNGSGIIMDWYCPNCSLATNDVLTLTLTSALNVADCHLYGMTGMATAPLDTSATAGGTTTCTLGVCTNTGDNASTTSTTVLNATPSTTTGIWVAHAGVNSQGVTGMSGQCASDMATSPQEATENDLDENNMKGSFLYSSASAVATTLVSSNPVNGWAAAGEFFKAAAAGGPPSCTSISMLGVGCK